MYLQTELKFHSFGTIFSEINITYSSTACIVCVAVEADIQGWKQGDWGTGEVRGRLLRRRHLTVHHLPHGGGSLCYSLQTRIEIVCIRV